MRLWVTRTAPAAEATAERLRALGHEVIVAPVLEVEPQSTELDLEGVGALAFTSRNAVTACPADLIARAPRVFTVGDATAQAARGAGFGKVESAQGDGEALAALILSRRHELGGEVLHFGPEEPAFDLAGGLRSEGVRARFLPLYRTKALPLAQEVREALDDPRAPITGVLVHSPKAGRVVAELLSGHPAAGSLTAYAISAAAAAALAALPLAAVRVAEAPTEQSMISLIEQDTPLPPLLGVRFWVLLAFGLACVAGGAAVALLGPRL